MDNQGAMDNQGRAVARILEGGGLMAILDSAIVACLKYLDHDYDVPTYLGRYICMYVHT